MELVKRTDLIDLVSLSKGFAKHHQMSNAEACDWITSRILDKRLAVYDISGNALAKLIEPYERAENAVIESFNKNWWRYSGGSSEPNTGVGLAANEVAIRKIDAEKHCNVPSEVLLESRDEEPLNNSMPRDSKSLSSPSRGRYVSAKLAKLNQAAEKFWANADPDDRGTHTDNRTVEAWLVKNGFSSTLAEKGATIIRPEWAPTGRKPEE